MSDFTVRISFKNKDMETVVEKEYDFLDYTMLINLDLKKILGLIENAFIYMNGGNTKEQWSKDVLDRFNDIRHKLLDQANAVRRLPETLSYKNIPANSISFGEYLARTIK